MNQPTETLTCTYDFNPFFHKLITPIVPWQAAFCPDSELDRLTSPIGSPGEHSSLVGAPRCSQAYTV